MSTCDCQCAPARLRRFVRCLIVAGLFGLWPRDAGASEVFPPVMREQLGLAADPPCTICHTTDQGGEDTVTRSFGIAMTRLGVAKADTRSLVAALQASESQQIDSDGDGIADITELREGSDPNDGPTGSNLPIAETGCAIGTSGSGFGGLLVVLAGIAVARIRRRRLSPGVAQFASRSPRQC